jgi:predicted dehydrogenase
MTAMSVPPGTRRLRLGMVGGGEGAFIGAVHRMAARLDDRWVLVAGALSSDPARAAASAAALHIAPGRCYAGFEEMAAAEAARADGIDAVAIVTPNHLHAPVARAFLHAGIHVICDKPLATTLAEGRELVALARTRQRLLAVTYNYSGYPMVRHARRLVAQGRLGRVRLVQVEYTQDWLANPIEAEGRRQAAWRTDPARAGAAGCLGDIGTHAIQLACFVTGLRLEALAAELSTFVPGRRVDDNVHALLRFEGGGRGALWASQVAAGAANGLVLRVHGEAAGIEFAQERPEELRFTPNGGATTTLRRGQADAAPAERVRVPAGHPEGFIEAFATLYADIADRLHTWPGAAEGAAALLPTGEDGVQGLAFVEAALASAARGGAFVPVSAG